MNDLRDVGRELEQNVRPGHQRIARDRRDDSATHKKKMATMKLYLSPLRSSVSTSDSPGLSLLSVRLMT